MEKGLILPDFGYDTRESFPPRKSNPGKRPIPIYALKRLQIHQGSTYPALSATLANHCQTSSVKLTDRSWRRASNLGTHLPDVFHALLLITISINGWCLYLTISRNGCQGWANHVYKWLNYRSTYRNRTFLKAIGCHFKVAAHRFLETS